MNTIPMINKVTNLDSSYMDITKILQYEFVQLLLQTFHTSKAADLKQANLTFTKTCFVTSATNQRKPCLQKFAEIMT